MNTIQTSTTRSSRHFAVAAIVGALALGVAAIGTAIHDHYNGVDPTVSTPVSSTGAGVQGVDRDQVVRPKITKVGEYMTEVGEALAAE